MEPVFMILGQSAATAAVLAINDNCPLQKLSYDRLHTQLAEDKQMLAWSNDAAAPKRPNPNQSQKRAQPSAP
jgi:hypothetical protein